MRIKALALLLTAVAVAGPARAASDAEWKPCGYEDGSGQARCVWDARHMGNGSGHSVKIINGGEDDARYIKITHRRARVLLGDNHAEL
jgi:hypothetical protein